MTKAELLAKVAAEGWAVVEDQGIRLEGTGANQLLLTYLLLAKPQGTFMQWQKVNYYTKVDGSCYWQQRDPFYIETPVVSFWQQVQDKIVELVNAATIKAGYIEKVNEASKTALAVAIKPDNSLAMYHICKVGEELTITAITGTYPT